MICRKPTFTISVSTVMIPDAKSLSSRAQNRGFCARVTLSAASGRVIADIFEILPGWGRWYNGTLAVKRSVMIGWFGDKLLD